MPLSVTIPSQNKALTIPFRPKNTVKELLKEVERRANLNTQQAKLFYNGGELFEEDTLEDLGIKDQDLLTVQQATTAAVGTTATVGTIASGSEAVSKEAEKQQGTVEDQLTQLLGDLSKEKPKEKIKQLDVVVLDLSGSMRAKAFPQGPTTMTRIEAAQSFFQTYIDKFFAFEFSVAVGLVCFGSSVETTFPISREYDNFSNELGNVDATQGSTRLYDAILLATKMLNEYKSDPGNLSKLVDPSELFCRVLCLTDGADNSSVDPYIVYTFLKSSNVLLDSIPIGFEVSGRANLSVLTAATGGSCFDVASIEDGLQLFEREAVLSLAQRENFKPFAMDIPSATAFKSINQTNPLMMVKVVEKKQDQAVKQKQSSVTQSAIQNLEKKAQDPTSLVSPSAAKLNPGCIKRIIKELVEITQIPGVQVFYNEDDISFLKIALLGPHDSPYKDSWWLISVRFPADYPFAAPRVLFVTPIYHCNVNTEGSLCLDILKEKWSAALSIRTVIQSISVLLIQPNPDDPLDSSKAALFRDNKEEYNARAIDFKNLKAFKNLDDLKKEYNLE